MTASLNTVAASTESSRPTATLSASIRESGCTAPLPAWVRITAADGTIIDDWKLPGLAGFPCDGKFSVEIPKGKVKIEIHRRISHEWAVEELDAVAGQVYQREYQLKPWVPMRERGYFCGDSHNHVRVSLDKVALYCRAMGIDYLDLCQGWGYKGGDENTTGSEIEKNIKAHCCDDMHLYFGAERPKTRYGHTWWLNLKPFEKPNAEYLPWHDTSYYDHSGKFTGLVYDIRKQFPYRNELNFHAWKRYRDQGAACVAAHPTSWWVDRPDATLIATNISADLCFALLAGDLMDGMVVMGYDADHVFYQNLWFRLLNEGYDLPGMAESDGCVTAKHRIGELLTYIQTPDGKYSPEKVIEGLRKSRMTMSSGPLLLMNVNDGEYHMGDHVPADGLARQLVIDAWADANPAEYLTHIIVYRNGEIYQHVDLSAQRPRQHTVKINVRESDSGDSGKRAWYVAKAYGSDAPSDPMQLDVFKYVTFCESQKNTDYIQRKQVAITNPIYFVPKDWQSPKPVRGQATIHLVHAESKKPVVNATVRAMNFGQVLATATTDAQGAVQFTLPPTAEIEILNPCGPAVRKSILIDYDPVNDCVESLFAGKWRETFPTLQPGQVPWSAFRFGELRERLRKIDWVIVLP